MPRKSPTVPTQSHKQTAKAADKTVKVLIEMPVRARDGIRRLKTAMDARNQGEVVDKLVAMAEAIEKAVRS